MSSSTPAHCDAYSNTRQVAPPTSPAHFPTLPVGVDAVEVERDKTHQEGEDLRQCQIVAEETAIAQTLEVVYSIHDPLPHQRKTHLS